MNTKSIIGALSVLLATSACSVQSLHPLYSEEVLWYDEAMEGDWVDNDGRLWTLENAALLKSLHSGTSNGVSSRRKMYLASYADEKDTLYAFEIHLLRLGKQRFVDIFPWEKYTEKMINGSMIVNLLPVHTFAKIELRGDSLFLSEIDGSWVKDLVKNNQIRISHEKVDLYGGEEIILTASTEELQKFIIKYQNDPKAFLEPDIFVRRR